MRTIVWTAIAATCTLGAGCSEYGVKNDGDGVNGPAPDIVVTPDALVFGELTAGDDEVQTFTVKNVGEAALEVSDVVIGSGLAFTVLGPNTTFELEPEAETTVDVAFTPMGADENFGQVLVLSNDPDTPEATVDLLGYGAVPELQISPDSYVFGDSFVPCGDSVELTLTNVGSEALEIYDWRYETSAGMMTLDDAALRDEGLPIVLQPNDSRVVTVHFAPSIAGADTGVLTVVSNDPREEVSADQNGEGTYADDAAEIFTEPGVVPVDVMMLIDQSGSMEGANQADVEQGIPPFVAELRQVADWQMILITDGFTADAGCANGGIIDSGTQNPEQLLINNAWNHVDGFGDGDYTESLLELASIALDKTGPGQCNSGFTRPGALLHIIVVSDEEEQSGQTGPYWLGQYAQHVPAQDFVKVSGVLNLNAANGYDAAISLSGGSLLDISGPWGTQFGAIASEVLEGIRTYNLGEPAVPESIVVTVNGTPTTDFSYSDASNSVTIESPPIGEGDVVEVVYNVAAQCN